MGLDDAAFFVETVVLVDAIAPEELSEWEIDAVFGEAVDDGAEFAATFCVFRFVAAKRAASGGAMADADTL